MNDIQTKSEAVAYVSAVLCNPLSLLSPAFKKAMDLSRNFDINAQDVLQFRKERVQRLS